MDTATAKRNALLQRRTPPTANRTNARVTRPTPVVRPPPVEDEEELPQAFGKDINKNNIDESLESSDNNDNNKNGESGDDDEEDDPYSPLNGPSPSPAPPRYDDPQQLLRRNNNTSSNPKTAIRAGAIEKPKSIAAAQQKQQSLRPPAVSSSTTPATTTSTAPPPAAGSTSSYLDEYIFKVCVVGNHNVGKTSLVRRMCNPITTAPGGSNGSGNNSDVEQILHTRPTIGVDFSSRVVENIRPGALVRMQLWDTAGLEKFAAVSAPVYRNCAGVIAVVDVLNRDTLDALVAKWLPAVLGQLPTLPLSSVLVLCNKMDLLETFTDPSAQNKNNAGNNGVMPQGVDPTKFTNAGEVSQVLSNAGINDTLVMEVSAKSGLNVEDAISLLCNRIIDKIANTNSDAISSPSAAADGGGGQTSRKRGGKDEGGVATSPNKILINNNKSRRQDTDEVEKGGSDDDEEEDDASPRESNNKQYPTTTKNTTPAASGGGRRVVNLQDAKKEPLETSTSSSVRSKKSNATYCPC